MPRRFAGPLRDPVPQAIPSRPHALAIFAKAARPGRVKTRLAPALSPAGAAEFHALCTAAVWRRFVATPGLEAYLYCDIRWPAFEREAGSRRFRLQRGPDLGARMFNCLRELLDEGRGKALIIGSDAPTLPSAQLEQAIALLDDHQVALGPSGDGGFTLIGATETRRGMFDGVLWSREDTLEACQAAIASAGLAVGLTASSGFDIDTPADLERLAADPGLPPSLGEWLAQRDRPAS